MNFEQLPQTEDLTKDSSYKKILTTLLVVLGIVVVAGGVLGYFQYFKTESKEEIVSKAIENTKNIKSFSYDGQAQVTMEYIGDTSENIINFGLTEGVLEQLVKDGNMMFNLNFNGIFDSNNPENIKQKFEIGANSNIYEKETGLEIRKTDNSIYFKLNEGFLAGPFDLSSLAERWFKWDANELIDQMGMDGLYFSENSEVLDENTVKELGVDIRKQIARTTPTLLKFIDKPTIEKVNDIYTYHLELIADKEKINEIVNSYRSIIGEDDNLKFLESLDLSEELEEIALGVWIGKEDHLVYKFNLKLKYEDMEDAMITNGLIDLTTQIKDHNKQFEVEAPQQHESLQKFIEKVFKIFISSFTIPQNY